MHDVSWFDAVRFCNRLSIKDGRPPFYHIEGEGDSALITIVRPEGSGYRLPTEAEFEYACRAATTTRFPFGDDEPRLEDFAWSKRNSAMELHATGTKRANRWGLYDMLGSVWEWCQDGHEETYYQHSPGADPQGPAQMNLRTIRGGSIWDDFFCRPASRQGQPPETRWIHLGFRVAAFAD